MKKIIIIAISILIVLILFISFIVESTAREYESILQSQIINDSPYSDEIEIYRNTVTTYCQTYNITEYIETVMKMLSFYSTSHSTDVLNSSYSYLNVKYPHRNEGITDADYSIRIGVEQLSEWITYISKTHSKNPIEEESVMLVLLQAYELQDKGYIDYALSGSGYSSTDVLTYCSSKNFNSEKPVTDMNSRFAATISTMQLSSDITITDKNATAEQKKIVEIALDYNNYSKNGITTKGGYCLNFTNDILNAAGIPIHRSHCARCAGDYYGVSNDWNSIPIGAEIYANASQQNGHVGIYVGDGYVVHCTTSNASGGTVLKYVPNGKVVKQSLQSFISGYNAKCWGFSGALSDKYPYHPGKYINSAH